MLASELSLTLPSRFADELLEVPDMPRCASLAARALLITARRLLIADADGTRFGVGERSSSCSPALGGLSPRETPRR